MEKYDYLYEVAADVANYINSRNLKINEDYTVEDLLDDCMNSDEVTGNASGSYFCNAWRAEECLAHNWELTADALAEFGLNPLEEGAESCDVLIRCHVLPEAIKIALSDWGKAEEIPLF